ncbi:hypothetical protein SERLA73DRAFT_70048 [Serpula lacrymans var. lacrymans S7.3]|uniref:Uncharacterized protein n=2 Tax=Serpula lacrymans var. lacrymans TaxID=341189 RepID=F8PLQ9_SERL3|nr:uncharacterized protein SERLADRAFT_434156 [Serpula lacrymans var. lacrymans S7.9]EGO02541.1 hypothetical protein SERLA73DRAFT_70048 [Serpula lacrymans var. lacrymans S7.3]EGO28260.1 hypothetical protein SERLADRAFT_434156 [Serpula lacrymans var. lacrymans S7.9]
MSMQPEQIDVNTILHRIRQQIMQLVAKLSKLQANPPEQVEPKFNKKVEIVAHPSTFDKNRAKMFCQDSNQN